MEAIEVGELCSGERLPGESKMAEMLPFSSGTVQRALSHLAERGAVVRRHGLGTFVTDNLTQLNELLHFRFLSMEGVCCRYSRRSLTWSRRRRTVPGQVPDEEEFHIRIDRDIDVNHEFRVVSRVYCQGARFAKLLKDRAARADNVNIRALLRERFNAPTLRVVEQVGAETMPVDVTNDLDLIKGSTALCCISRALAFAIRP